MRTGFSSTVGWWRGVATPLLVATTVVAATLGSVGCDATVGGGPTYGTDHPRIYLAKNKPRLQALLTAGGASAMRFKSIVDDQLGGADLYQFDAWFVALIGQLTGDPKYCKFAIAQIDQRVSSELDLANSGSMPMVASDDYLGIGDAVGDIAITYDWCFDSVASDQRQRWLEYADQAVFNVWNPTMASWGGNARPWDGWAINDPTDNYYYSFLRATMLLGLASHGEIANGQVWLDKFRQEKIASELVPTFDSDLVGGASREGTGYGVSLRTLWQEYDFWQGSTDEDIATLTPHTRASMLAMIHQIVPTLDRFAPTGDQSRDSTASLFDYHRDYLQTLAYMFKNDPLAGPIQTYLATSSVPKMTEQFDYVVDFLYDSAASGTAPTSLDTLGTAYYAPGIGELYARSGWDQDASWINMIAGPYTETHAHHDQGSLMVYRGEWLAYDEVVDSTSGIRQEEQLHNLVRIDDSSSKTVPMKMGTTSQMVALHSGTGYLYAAADLTPAYGTVDTISNVGRELVYLPTDNVVVIYDRVQSASGTSQTWQLNSPLSPSISGASAAFAGANHTLHVDRVLPSAASSSIYNWTTDPAGDFHGGFRFEEKVSGGNNQFLHVLSFDADVVSTVSSTIDSRDGVVITFADGHIATVAFSAAGQDATLSVTGLDGATVVTTQAFASGVDTLPE